MEKHEIIKYRDGDFELDVDFSPKEETVWLSVKQMSELVDVSIDNVALHIKNIINEGELEGTIYEDSSDMVQNGRKYKFKIYNLEMITSIGYRIKSKRGIAFRRWANQIIKQYLINGYAINERRIMECEKQILELQIGVLKLEARDYVNLTFTPNSQYEGVSTIINLFKQAKNQIIIVDNYFDHEFDIDLKNLNVNIIVITDPSNKKIETNNLYKVYKTKKFHDRYIVIDDTVFHCGSSLRSLGEKVSTISKIKDLDSNFFLNSVNDEKENLRKTIKEMNDISKANGNSEMTLEEINEIITETRNDKK